MVELNTENFDRMVLDSDKPVLVDFWATWCGPCRMLSSIVDKVAEDHKEIRVCKANIDDIKDIAVKYNISSVPTLLFFKDGEEIDRMVGMTPRIKIDKKIEELNAA